ncbi:MAG TPA: DUF411 domain-containing protein [Aestuariivirga sp.]|nr:DUF411 domain-containing protein [Aestuariivirga sp.]
MNRRTTLLSLIASASAVIAPRVGWAAAFPPVAVYRNPGCGCCEGWVKHMIAAGFKVTMEDDSNLNARRESLKIPAGLASCHIALADGYAFEGHIPVEDVVKFLKERPVGAIALVVSGMPMESPGMETGGASEAFDIMMISANAAPSVYASH